MNMNRVKRAALNQSLKFHHSSSEEYKRIEEQIAELDRQYHIRVHDPRKLSREEMLAVITTPPYKV